MAAKELAANPTGDDGIAAGLRHVRPLDLVRAGFELAWANRRLRSRSVRDLLGGARSPAGARPPLTEAQHRIVARVAYAIPRAGARVPWRSDCLVQALAGQRWLASAGVPADVCLGVRNASEFGAHAWLLAGGEVVTGGDISGYTPLLTPAGEFLRT